MVTKFLKIVNPIIPPQSRLIVELGLRLPDHSVFNLQALIDRGTEVNLIRRGLLDPQHFVPSENPRRFLTVDSTEMAGGKDELHGQVLFWGEDMATGICGIVEGNVSLYDARITVDAIFLMYGSTNMG